MGAVIVSPDEIKKDIKGYNPSVSHQYHQKSVSIADNMFKKYLKDLSLPESVILMCGGAASGKSEYIDKVLESESAIIYDGTLSCTGGAKVKIRNIKRYHKKCGICAVIVDSPVNSFHVFINRDRQYPLKRFYETHSGCRSVLKRVNIEFPEVEIKIIESYTDNYKGLKFRVLSDKLGFDLKRYIDKIQLTESEIENIVSKNTLNE